ncbi:hypothetical protein DPEC_G00100750 [Dallia pectoralis]|uniref:Uncharacterized protein n=1 Tax=Dallia pectoralis TaxID=75939 RepID=A0ACC2GXB8_DALPE|nr:hypothetical protein DPEC_G00100750 [Dallia pectoralis]
MKVCFGNDPASRRSSSELPDLMAPSHQLRVRSSNDDDDLTDAKDCHGPSTPPPERKMNFTGRNGSRDYLSGAGPGREEAANQAAISGPDEK